MRHAAAEKLEIIRLVEQSSLSVRRTLAQLGPPSTFYCWYERYRARDAEGLEDRTPAPRLVWNKLPAAVTQAVLELALKEPELSPRELAVSFVDQQQAGLRRFRSRLLILLLIAQSWHGVFGRLSCYFPRSRLRVRNDCAPPARHQSWRFSDLRGCATWRTLFLKPSSHRRCAESYLLN